VREIKYLADNYGAQVIYFTDDAFGADPMWISEFTSLMKTAFKPGDIMYVASTRVDSIDPKMLKDLYRSGLRTAFHGIESGSPRCWKMLDKNFDPKITRGYIVDLIRKEVENGIVPSCSFIVAFPNETEEDLDKTISLCRELASLDSLFSIQILAPNKGTVLFEDYQDLIKPFDVYREFGESENFSSEFRAVFGEKLKDFFDYLPDNRWFKPSMPLDRFKQKFSLLIEIAESSYIRRTTTLKSKSHTPPSDTHYDERENGVKSRLVNALKRLLRSS